MLVRDCESECVHEQLMWDCKKKSIVDYGMLLFCVQPLVRKLYFAVRHFLFETLSGQKAMTHFPLGYKEARHTRGS